MQKYYETIENIINSVQANELEEILNGSCFPWYLQKATTSKYTKIHKWQDDPLRFKEIPFLSHLFCKDGKSDSSYLGIAVTLFNAINRVKNNFYKDILRCQANLTFPSREGLHSPSHVDDFEIKHHVGLYFVNDCDGSTLLLDEDGKIIKEILPKKGSILLFDGSCIHAGGIPFESQYRTVINFNLLM
jgi:hypothetical protein